MEARMDATLSNFSKLSSLNTISWSLKPAKFKQIWKCHSLHNLKHINVLIQIENGLKMKL